MKNPNTPQEPQVHTISEILAQLVWEFSLLQNGFDTGQFDAKEQGKRERLELKAAEQAIEQILLEVIGENEVEDIPEPELYQGVGGGSAPFFCSACQMSEMKIMDNKEGDKYYCACSYWTDPHNAYLDRSGGKWLGWKNKQAAVDYVQSLPTDINGRNDLREEMRLRLGMTI